MFISSRCCGVDGPSLPPVSRLLFVISYKLHTDQWETCTLVGFLRIISARYYDTVGNAVFVSRLFFGLMVHVNRT